MHMLDNPIITYINFILLKHDIVAFVTNSECKKKSKSCTYTIQRIYYQTQAH